MKNTLPRKFKLLFVFCLLCFVGNAQIISVKQTNVSTGWSNTLVSAATVCFPTAAASSSNLAFIIKNDGASTLQLTGNPIVSVSGLNSSEFVVTQPSVTSLAVGASTTFSITYLPTSSAIKTAQVNISNNSGVNPFIINLKGAAFDLYGAQYPPIGTISFDSNGTIGRTGGGNLLLTNVSLATKTTTYWGPSISNSGDLQLKVSLDNSGYTNGENLTFASAESNLPQGKSVWRGNTFIQNAISNTTVGVFIRATLTTKKADNSVIPLTDPTSLGLSAQIGGLVPFTALSDYLVANYFIEASLDGTTWQPYLDFYDAYPTPPGPLPGQGIGNAYSSVSNGFYWSNLAPKLTKNVILDVNEGATTSITTAFLNASDDEDMPTNPQNIVFHFDTQSAGTSPMVFEHGAVKLNGTLLTKTSTFTLADIQNGLLTFTHDGTESTYDEFQFSIKDSKGKNASDGPYSSFNFKINIVPVNDSPIALNHTYTSSYAVAFSGNLTATDPDSTTFTYTILSNPTHGSISGFNASTGAFTYTPTSGVPGSDTFTFKVNDGIADSNTATITINLVNLAPIGTDVSFTTTEDIQVVNTLTATDPEGTSVSFQLNTQAAKGVAIVSSNGNFTYTPNTSQFGQDTFTYKVQDAQGNLSSEYTVTIKIIPRLDPGDLLVVDKTLIRLYDTTTNQDIIITKNQGLSDGLNVCYKKNVGLFVYDKGNGLIRVDLLTGNQSLVAPSSSFSSGGPIGGPSGMIIDKDGNLVISMSSGIVKVNPTTGTVTSLFSGNLLSYPTGVSYLENGDLLVSDAGLITGGNSRIIRITPSGTQTEVCSGLTLPLDIALIDQNTLVVGDAGSFAGASDNIYKVDITTGVKTVLSTGGDLAVPSGIDYWKNKIYVANKGGSQKIIAIDSNTGTQTIVSGTAITNPWGLMVIPQTITIPPTSTDQTFCNAATVADLVATGTDLKWYDVAVNGSALVSTTALANGTYYVSQTLDNVESVRVAVNVTINLLITPTFTAVAPICSGATLTALPTTSNNAIEGTWLQALDNTTTTTYLFTPNSGQCATTTTLEIVVNQHPAMPTLACYESAKFNMTTCSWDVTGTQPAQPTLACYESATFNTTSCSWDVTGTQPVQPTLACYESATFNTTSCSWDVTGTQPAQPTLACYESATFNTTSCSWEVTGTQPVQPTLACYESATFNTTSCSWDVTGTQPAQPTLACYESATFNTTSCSWDVTGTQPVQPTLACYESATFNTTSCSWDVTGTQPAQPTLACYESATFNTTSCSWDVTGTQPAQPTLACYESATFNTTSCSWDVTGTQPAQPTLACYESATFNTTSCSWDVTGTQPAQPTLACYESATFNTTSCSWDVTGTQPAQPTLACYESATFNTTSCSWDVTGTQPAQPTLACYESATFNTTSCSWDVTGTQPAQPTLACFESATFNTTSCSWDVTGTQPAQPTLACYESATFNTTSCSWDVTGTQPAQPTLACYESATFNTTSCSWDVTGTAPEAPIGDALQTFVAGQTLADIVVSGTGIVWYASANDAINQVSPLASTTPLVNGITYYATQTVNVCTSTASLAVTVTVTLANASFEKDKGFSMYPNPVATVLYLDIPQGVTVDRVLITDVNGKIIVDQLQTIHQIQVQNWAQGLYFIQVFSKENKWKAKFIKE